MKIAISGPSGSGKSTLAAELAEKLGLRHVEIDALHHGPNWESCGPDVLRERVAAATAGDDWVTDSTYHTILGRFIVDRADVLVWLDPPAAIVIWRLIRRTYVRRRDKVVLWNGNVEAGMAAQIHWLFWPALKKVFANRREFPQLYRDVDVRRLRSDAEVRAFVQSIQATPTMSGSSIASERQNTPPSVER